jgi:hypothetical protein
VPIPLQLTFFGMAPMPSVGLLIAAHADRLESFAGSIIRCHVIVGHERRHDRKGCGYSVDLDISTPRGSISVSRDPDASRRGLGEMLRQAFEAAARELDADASKGTSSVGAATAAGGECDVTSTFLARGRSEGGPHAAGFERRDEHSRVALGHR